MDTRSKIISAADAQSIAQDGAFVVTGFFDPLVADLAERLQDLKQPTHALLVLIESPADEILSAPARATLVAGLRCVDYVCSEPSNVNPQLRLEKEHQARTAQLIDHVHARQQAK